MARGWLVLFVWIAALASGVAQKAAAPDPEFERVIQSLSPSKRSSARMLLARSGGGGRKVVFDALSDAGRLPQKGGPARDWPERELLARLKTGMVSDRWATFSGMLKAYRSEQRTLMLEMMRARIDLSRK